MSFDDFELIYSYSRKQAIQDGVLIDVSEEARASGFKIPVCIGDRLYHGYVVPPEGLEGEGQSLEGRLHDLFEMTKAAAANRWKDNRVLFDVLFLTKPRTLEKVQCLAAVGPGDEGESVMTIPRLSETIQRKSMSILSPMPASPESKGCDSQQAVLSENLP